MAEKGSEWPPHAPLADPNLESSADAIIAGSDEDIRLLTIRSAAARASAALKAGSDVSAYDHYASQGNVRVINGQVMVLGSGMSRPVRLGKGKQNRERRQQVIAQAQAAVAQAALDGAEATVLERTAAAGNVEMYPDGSHAVTLPITTSGSYSVHPPVRTTRNRGEA